MKTRKPNLAKKIWKPNLGKGAHTRICALQHKFRGKWKTRRMHQSKRDAQRNLSKRIFYIEIFWDLRFFRFEIFIFEIFEIWDFLDLRFFIFEIFEIWDFLYLRFLRFEIFVEKVHFSKRKNTFFFERLSETNGCSKCFVPLVDNLKRSIRIPARPELALTLTGLHVVEMSTDPREDIQLI